jgi:hypothetical protein
MKGGAKDLMSSHDIAHGCFQKFGVEGSVDPDGALGTIGQAAIGLLQQPQMRLLR